uniref:Transposase n=1 Tax=Mesocestoides corti TaxID=53468 RepID=A0A5K3G0H1_MESCO
MDPEYWTSDDHHDISSWHLRVFAAVVHRRGIAGFRFALFERIRYHQCRFPKPLSQKDRYNRTRSIDQSQARAPRQAPSIRVHHVGHAVPYILLLSRVLLWLPAYLPPMPLENRDRIG